MTQIADTMISNGVTVLVIVNLDSESGAAIQEKATSQGVATIDYDRLTLGGSARVLRLLRQHVGRRAAGPGPRGLPRATRSANIVDLNGSPTDNNATLFARVRQRARPKMQQLQGRRRAGRPGLGQRGGGHDLRADATPLPTARSTACSPPTTVSATRPSASSRATANRQGPGHRPGRHRRGPAEHPRRRPVHDGLQGRQAGGRRAGRRRHRAGQRREAETTGTTVDDLRRQRGASILLEPQCHHQGQRQAT